MEEDTRNVAVQGEDPSVPNRRTAREANSLRDYLEISVFILLKVFFGLVKNRFLLAENGLSRRQDSQPKEAQKDTFFSHFLVKVFFVLVKNRFFLAENGFSRREESQPKEGQKDTLF